MNRKNVCYALWMASVWMFGVAQGDVVTNFWQHMADNNQTTLASLYRWDDAANWSPLTVPNSSTAVAAFVAEYPIESDSGVYPARVVVLPDGEVTINTLYQHIIGENNVSGNSVLYLADTIHLAGDAPKIVWDYDGPNIHAFVRGDDVEISGTDSTRDLFFHGPVNFRSLTQENGKITWYLQEFCTNAIASTLGDQTTPMCNPDIILSNFSAIEVRHRSGNDSNATTVNCEATVGSPFLKLDASSTLPYAGALAHSTTSELFPEGAFVVYTRNLGTDAIIKMSHPATRTGTEEVAFDTVPVLPVRERFGRLTQKDKDATINLCKSYSGRDFELTIGQLALTNCTLTANSITGYYLDHNRAGTLVLEDVSACVDETVRLESSILRFAATGGTSKQLNRLVLWANKAKDNNNNNNYPTFVTRWSGVEVDEDVTASFDCFEFSYSSAYAPGLRKLGAGELRLRVRNQAAVEKACALDVAAGTLTLINNAPTTMHITNLVLAAGTTLQAEGEPLTLMCDSLSCADGVTVKGPIAFAVPAGTEYDANWQHLHTALSEGASIQLLTSDDTVWFGWGQTCTEVPLQNGLVSPSNIPTTQPSTVNELWFSGWFDADGVDYISAADSPTRLIGGRNTLLRPGYGPNLVSAATTRNLYGYIQGSTSNLYLAAENTILQDKLLMVQVEPGKTYVVKLRQPTNRFRVQFTKEEFLPSASPKTYTTYRANTTVHPADTGAADVLIPAGAALRVTAPAECSYLYVFYLASTDENEIQAMRESLSITEDGAYEQLLDVTTAAEFRWGKTRILFEAINGNVPADVWTSVTDAPTAYKGHDLFVGWFDEAKTLYFDADGHTIKPALRAVTLYPGFTRNYEADADLVDGFTKSSDSTLNFENSKKDWMLTLPVTAGNRYLVTITNDTSRFRLSLTDKYVTSAADMTSEEKARYAATAVRHPNDMNDTTFSVLAGSTLTTKTETVPDGFNRMYVFFYSSANSEETVKTFRKSIIVRCLDDEPILYPSEKGMVILIR